MIHAALLESGITAHLGGNIGGSLLCNIDSITPEDVVVLELSSAMLWWLEKNGGWSPSTAVLTNIEQNHIDWHGSFEHYESCKQFVFAHQTSQDTALTQDLDATFDGLHVLGLHNQRNAAVAFLAAISVGADAKLAREGIKKFDGLPHRLQCVREGCYNDSKSTTPSATKLAIDSFEDASHVHLIVGGYDKQLDLTLIASQSNRVACMYCIGATAVAIAKLATGKVVLCETLEEAVKQAALSMRSGDVLILSPGCASWDQFENYEARGESFCSLVAAMPERQQVH